MTTLRRLRPWLGTYVLIETQGADEAAASHAVDAAFERVAAVHHALSFHSASSELATLHRHAHHRSVAVGPHTWQVLQLALELAARSNGVFDPCIAPRLVAAGALPHPDAPPPDADASWRDIELLEATCQVRFHRPLWLDLGGIAKGYAVDCAVDVLRSHGLSSGVVNAGGDLHHFGAATQTLPLAVRDPADPSRSFALGELSNQAVATSGEFLFGRIDGAPSLSPIVDPHSGIRHAQARSVTVLAPLCAIADGLTKIVALEGAAAQPLLDHYHATAALIEAGQVHAAPGLWAGLGRHHTQFDHA